MVFGTTMEIGMFNGGMASLNSLLREWDVAARDCVQIGFRFADLHTSPLGWPTPF